MPQLLSAMKRFKNELNRPSLPFSEAMFSLPARESPYLNSNSNFQNPAAALLKQPVDMAAMWVFGYGSLIWKTGFPFDNRVPGFIKGYRRVFCQGSTDHRGTAEYPGRTVTLEPAQGDICWGVAYKINRKEDQEEALSYLEVRENQYDRKEYIEFYTDPASTTPAVSDVLVYIASADKKLNKNYLGPASLPEIASQIVRAEGPSGPNRDYLLQLEKALNLLGIEDKHVLDIADLARSILSSHN